MGLRFLSTKSARRKGQKKRNKIKEKGHESFLRLLTRLNTILYYRRIYVLSLSLTQTSCVFCSNLFPKIYVPITTIIMFRQTLR